jgi:wyosine [tRNA(Phe)-imidazoG37] synthetase (radical SAM superfamily)
VLDFIDRLEDDTSHIDYLTFIADGEPTLDLSLGETIGRLRESLDLPIAVISNAALLWREDVRAELARADWVSVSCDAVTARGWRRINRPHPDLHHSSVLDGIRRFAEEYDGQLVTETMLVRDFNDGDDELRRVAEFLAEISPSTAYVAVPTRPPAETFAAEPPRRRVELAAEIFAQAGLNSELLVEYEGDDFSTTGEAADDLLRITEVHPMRKQAVGRLLRRCGADWAVVESLLSRGELRSVEFSGETFYIRGGE